MLEIIKIEKRNGVAVVDSRLVAEGLGIEHRALIQLVRKHLGTIEGAFGKVAFEMSPSENSATNQNMTVAHLTKEQAEFIATLSKNTPDVIAFKVALVGAFNKQLAPKPMSTAQLLAMQAQVNLEFEQRMEAQEEKLLQVTSQMEQVVAEFIPAAEKYAEVVSSDDTMTVSIAAKRLNFKDLGERKLFAYLRDKGMVLRSNLPAQNEIATGRMKIDSSATWRDRNGNLHISSKTVITQKGLEYLLNRLKKEGYKQNQTHYSVGFEII